MLENKKKHGKKERKKKNSKILNTEYTIGKVDGRSNWSDQSNVGKKVIENIIIMVKKVRIMVIEKVRVRIIENVRIRVIENVRITSIKKDNSRKSKNDRRIFSNEIYCNRNQNSKGEKSNSGFKMELYRKS